MTFNLVAAFWPNWLVNTITTRKCILSLTFVSRNPCLLAPGMDNTEELLWRQAYSLESWHSLVRPCHRRHSLWKWSSNLQWETSLSVDCVKLLSTSHQSLPPSVPKRQNRVQRHPQTSMGPPSLQQCPQRYHSQWSKTPSFTVPSSSSITRTTKNWQRIKAPSTLDQLQW